METQNISQQHDVAVVNDQTGLKRTRTAARPMGIGMSMPQTGRKAGGGKAELLRIEDLARSILMPRFQPARPQGRTDRL